MLVSELIAALQDTLEVDGDLIVEVVSDHRPDEWYEVTDIFHETNGLGDKAFVIHTD